MNTARNRGAGAAGIVFVALFVVGTLFSLDGADLSDAASPGAADQQVLRYLSSSSNRVEHMIGAYLLILGAIAFLWFCQGLRAWLERAAPDDQTAGRLVTALSAVGAVMMVIAGMAAADVAGAVSAGGEPLPSSGGAARAIQDLTFPTLFVAFALVAAAVIATVAVAGRASEGLPRWLAVTAWVGVLGALGGIIFVPFVLPLLWFLAAGVTLLARGARPALAQP